jgi:heme exporter protein B
MLNLFCYVFYTELLLRLRSSFEWLYPICFFIIVITLFPLALSADAGFLQKYSPGIVWLAALLAIFLSINHFFVSDTEDAHLEQWVFKQDTAYFVLLAKIIAAWISIILPFILIMPFIGVLFHLSAITILYLILSLLIGTPLLFLIGIFCAALTIGLSQSGLLLSLLMLPLTVPILLFSILICERAAPMLFLLGITLLAVLFLPFAILALLRIGVGE